MISFYLRSMIEWHNLKKEKLIVAGIGPIKHKYCCKFLASLTQSFSMTLLENGSSVFSLNVEFVLIHFMKICKIYTWSNFASGITHTRRKANFHTFGERVQICSTWRLFLLFSLQERTCNLLCLSKAGLNKSIFKGHHQITENLAS